MAAGSTYTPIATTTLGTATSSYTFTSIPSTYTDLILILSGSNSASAAPLIRVGNGSLDSGTNYDMVALRGDGSTASSFSNPGDNWFNTFMTSTTNAMYTVISHLQNYSNTTTRKSIINRSSSATGNVVLEIGNWNSTSSINQIQVLLSGANLNAGTQITLYGIAAA
jgi:hypothetical protein